MRWRELLCLRGRSCSSSSDEGVGLWLNLTAAFFFGSAGASSWSAAPTSPSPASADLCMALLGFPTGGGWDVRYVVAAMIAACNIFGMTFPLTSISMKDVLRVLVT